MPYITREDGERFVIPSYRDVLIAKKQSLLRREVLLLSANYGEYMTLQRKTADHYEVAFSPDPGYLLGETVWHYFKRPDDLIYCEVIPNTSEAILVIVKSGSVYLDGSFPIDAIPDELVIFRTQQNNFEIYIYGDVPISETPEEGKFAFDAASVKSFTILDDPVFPTLPIVKAFQLQLVEVVLKSKGIGVFPTRQIILVLVLLGLIWMGWTYITSRPTAPPTLILPPPPNPYQNYINTLKSPDPSEEIRWLANTIWQLSTIPGWRPTGLEMTNNSMRVNVRSLGARTDLLFEWAKKNNATIDVLQTGFVIVMNLNFANRPTPTSLYRVNEVIANLTDSLSYIIPGNNMAVGVVANKGKYLERPVSINLNTVNPTVLDLVSRQLKNLPLILDKVMISINGDLNLAGTISLKVLGT